MPLQSVYIEKDDENEAPPSRVLKVTFFPGGHTPSGDFMEPVVFLAIGDYDESTYEDSFKSSDERQFSVSLKDLLHALGGLGAIRTAESAVDFTDPHAA